MRTLFLLFLSVISGLCLVDVQAQDALFIQWDGAPTYTNPALTGGYKGSMRLLAKYRNQYSPIPETNAIHTGFVSVEYKFNSKNSRKFNIGLYSFYDRSGEIGFTKTNQSISGSMIQNFGDPLGSHHEVSIGVRIGFGHRSLNPEELRWPSGIPTEFESEKSFGDVSLGANWKYLTDGGLLFQIGSALHHINRPNVSFVEDSSDDLRLRFTNHGSLEIPLLNKLSLIPSFHFSSQGSHRRLLLGANGKWYFDSARISNFQIGFYTTLGRDLTDTEITSHALSTTFEIDVFSIGIGYQGFTLFKDNALEFSFAYRIKSEKD